MRSDMVPLIHSVPPQESTGSAQYPAWFRIEDQVYASSVNECGDPEGPGRVAVQVRVYYFLRRTPKGVVISHSPGGAPARFIRDDATRRFACPTLAEALTSFVARKDRQRSILLKRAENALGARMLAISGRFDNSGYLRSIGALT